MDLHSALKTQVTRTFQAQATRFAQVRLQHGKEQFTETLHAQPSSFSSSGIQITDYLHFLGFRRSPCAFLGSECLVRRISADFQEEGFAEAFQRGYEDLIEATRHLEVCGFFLSQPEGWGFFNGGPSLGRSFSDRRAGGDGHTAAKSQHMKESADQYFKFVLTWLEGGQFKGWVTHYRPHHPPLSPEFTAALRFLGGFNESKNCPEFDFDWCWWRAMPYGEQADYLPGGRAEAAHRYFDSHEAHFSLGIEKLLSAHVRVARFGFTFLDVARPAPHPAPSVSRPVSRPAERTPGSARPFKYDLAISFAGSERIYAEELANLLRKTGLQVFYDDFYPEQLWGKDLATEFDRIYRRESRFCLMFVSEEYAKRIWTSHERRSALARMVKENGKEYILPVRVDGTDLDGLPPTIGYLSLSERSIDEIARMVVSKITS
jgi:hypothetical protein